MLSRPIGQSVKGQFPRPCMNMGTPLVPCRNSRSRRPRANSDRRLCLPPPGHGTLLWHTRTEAVVVLFDLRLEKVRLGLGPVPPDLRAEPGAAPVAGDRPIQRKRPRRVVRQCCKCCDGQDSRSRRKRTSRRASSAAPAILRHEVAPMWRRLFRPIVLTRAQVREGRLTDSLCRVLCITKYF